MARILGIDVGSRTVDAVWLEGGRVVESVVLDSGYDPQGVCCQLITRGDHELVVATGYGRRSAELNHGAMKITEIKAYALGAAAVCPEARSLLDVGGQDTKVIVLSSEGRVLDFEMNDKCAAGTGRFLEVMGRVLGDGPEEMSLVPANAGTGIKISSMCTVFAESEVTGLLHRGENRGLIALGILESITRRLLGMLKRIGAEGPLLFAGGVALNTAMVELVRAGFGDTVLVPPNPQLVGALGAALYGDRMMEGSAVQDAVH